VDDINEFSAKRHVPYRVTSDANSTGRPTIRERWLTQWNPFQRPKSISCSTALDNLYFCYAPKTLARAYYREQFKDDNPCTSRLSAFAMCLRVKSANMTNPARAQKMLDSGDSPQPLIYHSAQGQSPVWTIRQQPPAFFRRPRKAD